MPLLFQNYDWLAGLLAEWLVSIYKTLDKQKPCTQNPSLELIFALPTNTSCMPRLGWPPNILQPDKRTDMWFDQVPRSTYIVQTHHLVVRRCSLPGYTIFAHQISLCH